VGADNVMGAFLWCDLSGSEIIPPQLRVVYVI
jgi:hypothetical protein